MEVHNEHDVVLADALIQLRKAVDGEDGEREALASVLDLTAPDWRERADVINRIKELGVGPASVKTLQKYGI